MNLRVSPPLLIALGLAAVTTAVAFATFARADVEAQHDRLASHALRLATDAQAWSQTPALMNGGQGSFALSTFSPVAIGRDADDTTLGLIAQHTAAPVIVGRDEQGRPVARVTVWGPGPNCLRIESPGHDPRAYAPPPSCAVWARG